MGGRWRTICISWKLVVLANFLKSQNFKTTTKKNLTCIFLFVRANSKSQFAMTDPVGRNQNGQTRYRRDQNSVTGKYEIFNNFPAHSASTAPKSKIRHYSSWTWTNRLNYWCTNYKHKINWYPDGIIYYFWHVLLYFILLTKNI